MFKHILVPTDGSEDSEQAMEAAIELAKLCGARVTALQGLEYARFITTSDGWLDAASESALEQEANAKTLAIRLLVERPSGLGCNAKLSWPPICVSSMPLKMPRTVEGATSL